MDILGILIVVFGFLAVGCMASAMLTGYFIAPILLARSQNLGTFHYFYESMQFMAIEMALQEAADGKGSVLAKTLIKVLKYLKIGIVVFFLLLIAAAVARGLAHKA